MNNAVKYADHALGEFLAKARASSYWNDTLILVVADHNSRVYGDALVPVERFHIPAAIVGGGIGPQRFERIASQVDLAPTLIPMMGLAGVTPMPGRDLLSLGSEVPGRAIMQFDALQAYLEDDELVVLRQDLPPAGFRRVEGALVPMAPRGALAERAIAHATWAADSYRYARYGAAPNLFSPTALQPTPSRHAPPSEPAILTRTAP